MTPTQNLATLGREALLALVVEQQRQSAELTAHVEALHAEIERRTRDAQRQAAPCAKGKRVTQPKRPGRKPGTGLLRSRAVPLAAPITEPPVDVPVTLEACPDGGGPLTEERVAVASTTDLPPMPPPTVTQDRVAGCRCPVCGKRVRGQHPAVAPDQYGATAPRVGDRVLAAAPGGHYGVGLPVRKVPVVMAALTGGRVTQGAITQDAMRRATGEVGEA